MSQLLGISPLIVGLTVVAFGTSSPELAVSMQAGFRGISDISLGNVVGSNIFNILFILGISAIIRPLMISVQLIRLDVPIMIVVSVLLYFLGRNGVISSLEGLLLFVCLISYLAFLFFKSKKTKLLEHAGSVVTNDNHERKSLRQWLKSISFVAIGLILLIFGSQFLVNSGVAIAYELGVSQFIVALTIIAAGTSLPEVATSVMASFQGEQDIAVGNIVGSNIFNILAVLGLSGLVSSEGILVSATALNFDIPIMIVISVACLPVFFTGGKISRWEGLLFFGYYVAYIAYLVLQSAQHDAVPIFGTMFHLFIIPLTFITLLVMSWQALKRRRTNEIKNEKRTKE